ncbi:MAG: helix-turn-helix transcriptional regulator [Ruminococcaceae bacterium]|nr:helix-turn-helix transcriptional regulator [Oscillospiraceae bacterium]
MPEYSEYLGEAVRAARSKTTLTQAQVAEKAGIDNRTVLNIENNKGNPKLEVLYSLVRTLKIDPTEIFYPEVHRDTPSLNQLRILIEECSEEEAATIIPVLESVLNALRDKNAISIG